MIRVLTALSVCAIAQAASSSATLVINATESETVTSITLSGTATLTIGTNASSGSFTATAPINALGSGTTVSAPFTLSLSSGGFGGTIVIPLLLLENPATTVTGSATLTSASGGYSGDTGSFASLTETSSLGANGVSYTFSGNGTVNSGGTVTAPPPTITAVLDAASNTANLAQGTIFIVKGTNTCASSGLQVFTVPRPTVAPDGVVITFTPVSGGTGTNALLWYEDNLGSGACQLAGILQSTVPAGTYNVTVTNGTVSAPFQTTVVKSKFALFTQDSTGSGLAAAQDQVSTSYYLNRLTTGNILGTAIAPAYPGEYMVAYGTGLGPVPAADDNDASPVDDFSKTNTIQAVVGGISIPVLFAGRAGYAGEDQINFLLPTTVPTGCSITFQISVNGNLSPAATLSIAPNATAGACVLPGYTTSQLTAFDTGTVINSGSFTISQLAETVPQSGTIKIDSISGGFTQISGFELAALSSLQGGSYSQTTVGSCTVTQITMVGSSAQNSAAGLVTDLDAGVVTLTGPSGSNLSNTVVPESLPAIEPTATISPYLLSIGDEGINEPGTPNGAIVAGKYTLAGAGGKDVGAFNVSTTVGTPLTITGGLPTTIVRNQGLTLNWTGGTATDEVVIIGYSGTTTGSGASQVTTAAEFVCLTTAATGTFTVSPAVLGQLQATPALASGGAGGIEVASGPQAVAFAPSLTAGGTVAARFALLFEFLGTTTYQ